MTKARPWASWPWNIGFDRRISLTRLARCSMPARIDWPTIHSTAPPATAAIPIGSTRRSRITRRERRRQRLAEPATRRESASMRSWGEGGWAGSLIGSRVGEDVGFVPAFEIEAGAHGQEVEAGAGQFGAA